MQVKSKGKQIAYQGLAKTKPNTEGSYKAEIPQHGGCDLLVVYKGTA